MSLSSRLLVALAIAAMVVGCSSPAAVQSTPTLDEAQAFLANVVGLAQRGDFDGLCALGDGNCSRSLETAGKNAVPQVPPSVVGARVVPTTTIGDQTSIGGLVLVLCGHDASGAAYNSEMLVFRDASGLRAINPVYWDNTKIASGSSTPASPQPSGICQ